MSKLTGSAGGVGSKFRVKGRSNSKSDKGQAEEAQQPLVRRPCWHDGDDTDDEGVSQEG